MNDSKQPAVLLNALSMFENALTMFWNDFENDLQRILVPLKNIANVSKCNGNDIQRSFNVLNKFNKTVNPFALVRYEIGYTCSQGYRL